MLIQEISKIKNDRKEGDQQLNQAHAEAAHLRREMEKLQRKLKAVEITAQQQEQELLAATQKLQHRSFVDREDHSKENQHPQFEIQAEGGLATATPRAFQVRDTLSEREAKRLGEAAEAHYRVCSMNYKTATVLFLCILYLSLFIMNRRWWRILSSAVLTCSSHCAPLRMINWIYHESSRRWKRNE